MLFMNGTENFYVKNINNETNVSNVHVVKMIFGRSINNASEN